jgi:hypothetical protein
MTLWEYSHKKQKRLKLVQLLGQLGGWRLSHLRGPGERGIKPADGQGEVRHPYFAQSRRLSVCCYWPPIAIANAT